MEDALIKFARDETYSEIAQFSFLAVQLSVCICYRSDLDILEKRIRRIVLKE